MSHSSWIYLNRKTSTQCPGEPMLSGLNMNMGTDVQQYTLTQKHGQFLNIAETDNRIQFMLDSESRHIDE